MEKILRGVIRYQKSHKINMLKEFQRVRDNPQPKAVFISCIDSRIFPTQFTTAIIGDMLIVRNAGNLIPLGNKDLTKGITTEPGAIELGCIHNNIRDVVICGHSDCKAMNLLFSQRAKVNDLEGNSPLELWVKMNGVDSVKKYEKYIENGPDKPLVYTAETPTTKVEAFIDPEQKLDVVDRFSQINCLQQMQNIATYSYFAPRLRDGSIHLNAMWFDVYTGDVFFYCRTRRAFVIIDESTIEELMRDHDSLFVQKK